MFYILLVKQSKGVELYAVGFASFDGFHYAVECAFAGVVEAVVVVVFFWAVNADADEEIIFGEELTPFVVEEYSVGLETVCDSLARLSVFLFEFYHFFVVVEAHEGWFSALESDVADGEAEGDVVTDHCFEDIVGHAMRAGAEDGGFAGVETVAAGDVAVGAGWFY